MSRGPLAQNPEVREHREEAHFEDLAARLWAQPAPLPPAGKAWRIPRPRRRRRWAVVALTLTVGALTAWVLSPDNANQWGALAVLGAVTAGALWTEDHR